MVTYGRRSTGPFNTLEQRFEQLVAPPRPLSIRGEMIDGLPDREIPLDELRAMLLHPATSYATRDAALSLLGGLARREGGDWLIGLAGVLLPGLRRAAAALSHCSPADPADVEAEMLAGLIVAIAAIDLGRGRIAARLTWAARRHAERLVRAELAEKGRPHRDPVSSEPPRPFGHPDFVLARAVKLGVIRADDALLIAESRLEEIPLRQIADRLGITYRAARDRRLTAERALVQAIRDGFPSRPAAKPDSSRGGRPRQGRQ